MSTRTAPALALHGGEPVRTRPFPARPGLAPLAREAVGEVLESGVLSRFIGSWGEDFAGGPRVRALERAWEERFGVRHAVSMNSATSALNAAVAAVGAGPGDEVIVSPYTMSASATCALVNGAIPVFADIEARTYCLDPASVRERITPRTKAIVAVDIFGCPADYDALVEIAAEHGLALIEDAAQAPGGAHPRGPAGTLGDIGVFSLNYHKTIQSGEGGVAVTNDDALADRLRLARNHGEVVVAGMGSEHVDVLGFNYRMGEIEAAIADAQLRELDALTEPRIAHAARLTEALAGLEGVHPPVVPDGCRHVYYLYVVRLDPDALGIPRARFAEALRAEGVPVTEGYVRPIYREPLYQRRAAFPFGDPRNAGSGDYTEGICPTCERMHDREVLFHDLVHAGLSEGDVDDIAAAFRKVHARRHEL
jgi:dTDP-4-amino-4,6-dideoxygalactose transaminase